MPYLPGEAIWFPGMKWLPYLTIVLVTLTCGAQARVQSHKSADTAVNSGTKMSTFLIAAASGCSSLGSTCHSRRQFGERVFRARLRLC